ncbi:MAG TPA: hypothetical protein VJO99_27105, partial [Burkholderiaceae bacterium]|nr:hypothetical protein [Burkholderiaceae bacterium]
MTRLLQHAVCLIAIVAPALLAGCSAPALLVGAAGVATDTSVPWAIVKHMHDKITEGDPVSCHKLNSVQRALNARCGAFEAGSLDAKDIAKSGLQVCPLAVAVREPRFWPVLPELLDKGAQPEACADSPLIGLAQADACPDFEKASAPVLRSLSWLAEADARAVRHDVVRMLSCPNARRAGLDRVLAAWDAAGALNPDLLGFGVFGALHPDMLDTPFARRLEAEGHTARAGLGAYDGQLRPGFEEALRTSQWAALDWWLARAPELARSVPPTQGNRQPWLPLARVLVPNFLADPATQGQMVGYLLAHGASPRQRLPFDASQSILAYARTLKSPMVALLEAPPEAQPAARLAGGATTLIPVVAAAT